MNVLHICRNLAGSTVFPQMFEALGAEGIRQTVFVPENTEANRNKNVPRDIPTHYAVTLRASDTLFFSQKAARTVPYIEANLDLTDVELIHAHTLFTDGSIALGLAERHNLPFVVTLRYSDIAVIWKYELHLRPLARRVLRAAKAVVCLSPVVREQVLRFPGCGGEEMEKKCMVIPNGLDPAWLEGTAPRQCPRHPVRVGFAGNMNRRKRPLDALEAVHLADGGKGRFVFLGCGTGPLETKVRAGLRDGDRLMGRVSGREAMCSFYGDCDVLLVPSVAETFGMVYLEAMSRGVPVLYTAGQGFDGQFPEGEVGFSVPSGRPRTQAARLEALLEDYAARSARCIEGAGRYIWPLVTKKWLAVYQSALER